MENKEYKASIKTVGSIIAETKLILEKYLEVKDIDKLQEEIFENNLLLKKSKRRAENIFNEIKKRYLQDQKDGYFESPLLYLIKNIKTDAVVDLVLYYHLCKEERIIYEFNTEFVFNRYQNGYLGVSSEDAFHFIKELASRDENISKWTDRTIRDVKTGIIGVLKDFNFINSRKRPVFNKVFIPSIVFYYILYINKEDIKTTEDITNCIDFRLFLLLKNDLNILLEEAYRNNVIDFEEINGRRNIKFQYKSIKEIIDDYIRGEIH
jgi:hypothetical protein